jgi:hypothetical protein
MTTGTKNSNAHVAHAEEVARGDGFRGSAGLLRSDETPR